VSPSNQYLLIPNLQIDEFAITGNGTLKAHANLDVNGDAVAVTPDGKFVLVANAFTSELTSYTFSSLGALSPVSTVSADGYPEYVLIDKLGRFAYVSNDNDGTISEYSISQSGMLATIGSVSSGGYNPVFLAYSPAGFLYCANSNSRSVTQYSIDASTGTLTLVNTYVIWSQPQTGALWISFAPNGAYAYVGNSDEVAQFTVGPGGVLMSNGMTLFPNGINWGSVDPSGKFLITAGVEGNVTTSKIDSTGSLIPGSSFYMGKYMVGESVVFVRK
jgi:6-phosphogluconolactonase